jgi:hypothetical protein
MDILLFGFKFGLGFALGWHLVAALAWLGRQVLAHLMAYLGRVLRR